MSLRGIPCHPEAAAVTTGLELPCEDQDHLTHLGRRGLRRLDLLGEV